MYFHNAPTFSLSRLTGSFQAKTILLIKKKKSLKLVTFDFLSARDENISSEQFYTIYNYSSW